MSASPPRELPPQLILHTFWDRVVNQRRNVRCLLDLLSESVAWLRGELVHFVLRPGDLHLEADNVPGVTGEGRAMGALCVGLPSTQMLDYHVGDGACAIVLHFYHQADIVDWDGEFVRDEIFLTILHAWGPWGYGDVGLWKLLISLRVMISSSNRVSCWIVNSLH